jgi:hypothetical protein
MHWILMGSNFNHLAEELTYPRLFKYVDGEVILHGSEMAVPSVDANQFLANRRLSKVLMMRVFIGVSHRYRSAITFAGISN